MKKQTADGSSPDKNHNDFLRALREKGAGLALDYLDACRRRHEKTVHVALTIGSSGLKQAFQTLFELGKKILRRVEQIFGYVFGKPRVEGDLYEIDLTLTATA